MSKLAGVPPVKVRPPGPKPTRIQKAKTFATGFLTGLTSPVSAWTSLTSVVKDIKGGSLAEFGRNLGYLGASSLSLYFLVRAGIYLPEVADYFGALADQSWTFLAKKEIIESTTSSEVFDALSDPEILNRPISSGQYLNYFGPYIVAPFIGAGNEIAREKTENEPFSLWKTSYVAFRFLVGTALLVKLGELTWGKPFHEALGWEVLAWSMYYSAFTIPTAYARKKTPAEIDKILRKQVFYTAILTSLGLAALTTVVNPALLQMLGSWGKPEKLGHLLPVGTRGIWEVFITQMVLRAEFGGDEFVGRMFKKKPKIK